MSEPSERFRMALLVRNATDTAWLCGQDPGDAQRAENSHTADAALLTAIAELEQRAEKAEAERDILLQQPDNRLDGYRELGSKCAALEERNDALKSSCDKWKRVAVAQERAHQMRYDFDAEGLLARGEMRAAIEALGDEWTEVVKMTRTWYNQQWTPALSAVIRELERAENKFGPFHNTHEGYAVLLEEVDELWDAIKANDKEQAKKEAIQVTAMGLRFLLDLYEWEPENTKALEAQLGAADVGLSTDREAVAKLPISASSPPAAPSVSAEVWSIYAKALRVGGFVRAASACDLAAAVTRWYERGGRNDSDEADLMDIAGAFARGEKLPEVGT